MQCLLADRYDIGISVCRIVDEHQPAAHVRALTLKRQALEVGIQFVRAIVEIACDINCERKVAATMERSVVSVHEYSGFVVDGAKIEQHVASSPIRRDCERCGEPRVDIIRRLNAYGSR